MKRLRTARIFGSCIWERRELKEGQVRDLGAGRRLGEDVEYASMMGRGFKYVLSVPSARKME